MSLIYMTHTKKSKKFVTQQCGAIKPKKK